MLVTNAIAAKTSVECVGMLLDQAFDTANTNYTGSLALKVGDGSDDDLFLTSTELASDGTEVWVKYGPPNAGAIAVTPLTLSAGTTNLGEVLVMTNATAAFTASELSRKLYTTSGILVFGFTPNLNESVSANVKGKVRVYFRLKEFGR
jgi:hypothetical protein